MSGHHSNCATLQNKSSYDAPPWIDERGRSIHQRDVTDNKTTDTYEISPMNMSGFNSESERLKTFASWPLEWLDKNQLACIGMFYTGDDDKVKCYFCEVEIGCWEREDQPVSEHLRWSPQCPLLRRRHTNNLSINQEVLDRLLPQISYDICGANDSIEVRPSAYTEGTISAPRGGNAASVSTSISGNSTAGLSNTASAFYPEYPEYAIESARLRSFAEWPRHMKQKPEQLAEAGFFYTGVGDRVKCYSCGGGLKDWDDCDEPWEQHAAWLSKCRFLKLIKGQQYIDAVVDKQRCNKVAEESSQSPSEKPTTELSHTTPPKQDAPLPSSQIAALSDALEFESSVQMPPAIPPGEVATLHQDSMPHVTHIMASSGTETVRAAVSTTTSSTEHVPGAVAEKKSSSNIPEEKLCKICYAGEYNTAFLPCGHVVACAKCASSVTKCPLCRKPFTDVMRVYFS